MVHPVPVLPHLGYLPPSHGRGGQQGGGGVAAQGRGAHGTRVARADRRRGRKGGPVLQVAVAIALGLAGPVGRSS
jgi:hypothetical protein